MQKWYWAARLAASQRHRGATWGYSLAIASLLAGAVVLGTAGCGPEAASGQELPPKTSTTTTSSGEVESPLVKAERAKFAGDLDVRKKLLEKSELARLTIARGFGFSDGKSCVTPPQVTEADIDADRSLFVHDRATLDAADFSLRLTLTQLAKQAVAAGATGTTAQSLFAELWNTQNPASATTGSGAHCDDNGGTVNDFPVSCRPSDGAQAADPATEIGKYHAIGLVNRMDLAHENWRNCGEHRIVYGRNDASTLKRDFIIFEAVLPNPKPGCRSACKPVAEMWQSLSSMPDAADRAKTLRAFYYKGLPGFRPVVHIDHYTASGVGSGYGSSGSGQIRTNQFMQQPWLLKELRLALDCTSAPCNLAVVPTMVKVNPFGRLWKQEVASAPGALQTRAAAFQADMVGQVGSLAGKTSSGCPTTFDLGGFSYAVDQDLDAAESNAQPSFAPGPDPDEYLKQYDPAGTVTAGLFRSELKTSPDLCGLSDSQIVNRAVALSCAGCHQPAEFGLQTPGSIGPGAQWPNSLKFVHTNETAQGGIHELSPALINDFLPARRKFLVALLNQDTCTCQNRFLRLPDTVRPRALAIELAIDGKIEIDRKRLSDKLRDLTEKAKAAGKPVPLQDLEKVQGELRKLDEERDKKLQEELKKAGVSVDPVTLDLKPQVMKLDPARIAGADQKTIREVRQRAVLDLLRAEPPRRTVTGHFRVH